MDFKKFLEFNYPDFNYGNINNEPNIAAKLANHAIGSVGNLFRKRMGNAFPTQNHPNIFDKSWRSFIDAVGIGNGSSGIGSFVVVKTVPYLRRDDDWRHTKLTILAKNGIKELHQRPDIMEAAKKAGVNLLNNPDKIEYDYKKLGEVNIIYKYNINQDKLRNYSLQQPEEEETE